MPEEAKLKQKLNDDLRAAMRGGEATRVSTIRLLLSAIKNTEIARQATLTDPDILGVVAKEIKQRRESIDAFKKGNRQDLVDKEQAELNILESYMPRQMSQEEVAAAARKVIAEVGAKGPADKGKVMSKLMPELKGKADGKLINDTVTQLLSS